MQRLTGEEVKRAAKKQKGSPASHSSRKREDDRQDEQARTCEHDARACGPTTVASFLGYVSPR